MLMLMVHVWLGRIGGDGGIGEGFEGERREKGGGRRE